MRENNNPHFSPMKPTCKIQVGFFCRKITTSRLVVISDPY